jgi:large subunit ribosomal protein L4
MNLPIFNLNAEKVSEISIDKFDAIKVSNTFLHEVIMAHLANRRAGSASTKTRADVSGGGHKPWKQKGTGRARSGSTRSPLWRHGGVAFGPKPKSYRIDLPRQKVTNSIAMSLKSKIDANEVIVVKEFVVAEPKTKSIIQILGKFKDVLDKKILIVTEKVDNNTKLAGRNVENLTLVPVNSVNAYDILNAEQILITESALIKL